MHIAILAGGSTEREVSLSSARSIANALVELSYEHEIIDPGQITAENTSYLLRDTRAKFAFNVLHGGLAEGGGSQRFLELSGVLHPGTTSRSAYTLMHKSRSLQICRQLGISTPNFHIFTKQQYRSYECFPHIIKTIFGSGSSIGTCKIKSLSEQQEYLWEDKNKRLVLEFIHGLEYSCAIIDCSIFGGCMINYAAEFCSYEVKYDTKHGLYHSPVPDSLKYACGLADQMALKLYKHLQCKGLIRFDFMISDNMPYFLEANPSPGMTSVSIIPDIAQFNHNLSYTELIKRLLQPLVP